MTKLSHTDNKGQVNMVDVSGKEPSIRIAKATATLHLSEVSYNLLLNNTNKKGDVLAVAKVAGINAAKQCGYLIPLCHPILINKVNVNFELNEQHKTITVYAEVKTNSNTGVEMEALTSVSLAALTVYDMLKAADKSIRISDILLLEKQGGKSGDYKYKKPAS